LGNLIVYSLAATVLYGTHRWKYGVRWTGRVPGGGHGTAGGRGL